MESGKRCASVVVPCSDIESAIAYYTSTFGFHVIRIAPAEAPRQALIGRDDLVLCLDLEYDGPPPRLRLEGVAGPDASAPDGVVIEQLEQREMVLRGFSPTGSLKRRWHASFLAPSPMAAQRWPSAITLASS